MKKRILNIALASVIAVCTVGCGTTYQEVTGQVKTSEGEVGNGYFTVITSWSGITNNYYIAYAKDTRVKYFISEGGYQFGITPLFNADGTLQIYEE